MVDSETRQPKRILILGAGIAGLSAAYRLRKAVPDAQISLWEKANRVGGVIETVERDGMQFEQSADNFMTLVPTALDLCAELGLTDSLVRTNTSDRRTYVARRGKLHPLPDGFMMLAPTKLWPMVTTPLLSPFGKVRAGMELLLPRKSDDADETIAAFARRRLGREVFERIVEPLLSGIYAGDAEKISLMATLPRFRDLEEKHRSLIIAMTLGQKEAKKAKRAEESGARYSMFVTLREGLAHLPQRIAETLPKGTITLNRAASKVERIRGEQQHNEQQHEEQQREIWRVTDTTGQSECFDALVCALPSPVAGALFVESVPPAADFYDRMEQTSCAVVTFAFRHEQIKNDFRGMGFVVPTIEGGSLVAGSFSSHKYPHRAPEGIALIRIFTGGARAPEVAEMDPETLKRKVFGEIQPLLKIDGEPQTVEVARWRRGMPQYHLGHLERLAALDAALSQIPSLALCGNSFTGVGIPACIKSGSDAAEKIAAFCRTREY